MRTGWRGFSAAVRLGWLTSSNWTQPLLFVIYQVLRPISAALILAVMYSVITGGRASARDYLAFLLVGTAFWSFVQEGMAEFSVGVLEDRGRFKMLKYTYLAMPSFPLYLVGRATSKLTSAAASTVIVLVLGTVFLRLPVNPLAIGYPMLIAACLVAFVAMVAFGIALSILLLAARDGDHFGQISAQLLYVVSGAVFPITVLPGPLAAIASVSPLVYWLELCRRTILHGRVYQMFPTLSDGEVFTRLLLGTLGTVVLSFAVYRWADRRARRHGFIDMEANW